MAITVGRPGAFRDRRRWTIGIAVAPDGRSVRAAAVAAEGVGLEARAQVMAVAAAPVPRETRRLFRRLAHAPARAPAALVPVLASELAEVQAGCVEQLIAREPAVAEKAFCIGVNDPGLWGEESAEPRAYLGLTDAARLAELTGLNVLDAFSSRDLAQDGQGGPILVAGYWTLLRHLDRPRALIHLGSTTRFVWLPAARDPAAAQQAIAADAGPGMQLLDRLCRGLSGARSRDGGGSLAAQGKLRPDLLETWSSALPSASASRVWRPRGIDQRQLAETILNAVRVGATSGPDALRTATRLVVEGIVRRVADAPLSGRLGPELILTGAGRRNGLARQDLKTCLPRFRLPNDDEIDVPLSALDAAATAVLSHFYLDHAPANLPGVTGARAPRLLGRLTPGSPRNLLRLVRDMASQQPVVSLRTAI